MANLDLNSIWETVKTATSAANGGALSQSSLTNIATNIVTSALGSKSSSSTSGTDYIAMAKQLYSLYEKFKGSSDSVTKTAATNVKSISDIIGAMGGDKGSMISAGASILGNVLGSGSSSSKKDDSGSDLGSTLGKALGGLFGK